MHNDKLQGSGMTPGDGAKGVFHKAGSIIDPLERRVEAQQNASSVPGAPVVTIPGVESLQARVDRLLKGGK